MKRKASVATEDNGENQEGDVLESAPVISMVTNHTNGTLNLWQLTFDDKSKFSQVLLIFHIFIVNGYSHIIVCSYKYSTLHFACDFGPVVIDEFFMI